MAGQTDKRMSAIHNERSHPGRAAYTTHNNVAINAYRVDLTTGYFKKTPVNASRWQIVANVIDNYCNYSIIDVIRCYSLFVVMAPHTQRYTLNSCYIAKDNGFEQEARMRGTDQDDISN